MCAGSFHGTRTSGVVLVVEMPCSIVTIVWYSIMPCCMSTTSESQPAWAMTSAEKLDGMPSQLLMTGLPACHNSRTPFGRAMGSSSRYVIGSRSRQLGRRVSSALAGRGAFAVNTANLQQNSTLPPSTCSTCFWWKFAGAPFRRGAWLGSYMGILAKLQWSTERTAQRLRQKESYFYSPWLGLTRPSTNSFRLFVDPRVKPGGGDFI